MTIVDRRLIAIARGVELLAQLVPPVRSALIIRQSAADGFTSPPEVAVQSSSTTSSVESAAAARSRASTDLCDLDEQIQTLWTLTSDALRYVRRLTEPDAEPDEDPLAGQLCKPRGREGAAEWAGSLDCTELPVRRGLCQRHYMREYRWRRTAGLPVGDDPEAA